MAFIEKIPIFVPSFTALNASNSHINPATLETCSCGLTCCCCCCAFTMGKAVLSVF